MIVIDPRLNGAIAVKYNERTEAYEMPQAIWEIISLLKFIRKNSIGDLAYISVSERGEDRIFGILETASIAADFKVFSIHQKAWQKFHRLDNAGCKKDLLKKAREIYPDMDINMKTARALLILNYVLKYEHIKA